MKKILLLIFFAFIQIQFCDAQNVVNFNLKAGVNPAVLDDGATPATKPAVFKPDADLNIYVRNASATAAITLKVKDNPITQPNADAGNVEANTKLYIYPKNTFNGLKEGDVVTLTVVADGVTRVYDNVFSQQSKAAKTGAYNVYSLLTEATPTETLSDNLQLAIKIIKNKSLVYDRKKNVVNLVVGPDGELLSLKPVNIDEDDQINFFVICPTTEKEKYRMAYDGTYSPSDLPQGAFTAPTITAIKAQSSLNKVTDWDVRVFPFPPSTNSANGVTYTLKKITVLDDDPGKQVPVTFNTYNITVNKFSVVDYGVSIISTGLENPTFKVAPKSNSTDKTIIETDKGSRAIFAFNAILYWKSALHQLFDSKNDGPEQNYFRGRDKLKEPGFLDRLNPSVGFSISEKLTENYFFGGVFEFTRGASIAFGGHYGKVTRLYDRDQLGQTFTGTDSDIITTKEWHWKGYIGITLDTRIFNRLIGLGQ